MGFHPTDRYPRSWRDPVSRKNVDFPGEMSPPLPPTGWGGRLRVHSWLRSIPPNAVRGTPRVRGGMLPQVGGVRRASAGGLVVLERLGEPALDLPDAGLLGRVRRQELG